MSFNGTSVRTNLSIHVGYTMQRVVYLSLFCMPSDVILFSFLFDLPLFSRTRLDTKKRDIKRVAPAMAYPYVYVVRDIGFDHSTRLKWLPWKS